MRVLVTGAAGYLGRATVRHLCLAGHNVTALIHKRTAAFPSSVQLAFGDLMDRDSLSSAAEGAHAVVHLAAISNGRESFSNPVLHLTINTIGTMNLLDSLKGQSKLRHVIFASTCSVYASRMGLSSEGSGLAPSSPYAVSKVAAERKIIASSGSQVGGAILRFSNIAGALDLIADDDEKHLIPRVLAVAAGRLQSLVLPAASIARDFVHLDDAAAAIVAALECCTPGTVRVYNVSSGVSVPLMRLIKIAESITGRPIPVLKGGDLLGPGNLYIDNRRIQTELGWTPRKSDVRQILGDAWSAARSSAEC